MAITLMPHQTVISTEIKIGSNQTLYELKVVKPTSLIEAAALAGRGDLVVLTIGLFSVFSFKGEAAFSAADKDTRVVVAGLGEVFVDKVDEVAFGLGFAVVARLVGFGGALNIERK